MNRLKTMMLLATLTALFLWVGQSLGGQNGLIFALVFAGIFNFGSYWFSDKIVLAMYGAKELSESDAPEVHSVVRNLSQHFNIPTPRVYLIPQETPNAFATGRNPSHAAVAVTEAIMLRLTRDEASAATTNKPLTLPSALQKLESWKKQIPMMGGPPATAHLFIINPFSGQSMARLFSTHPPTEERIKRLEEMADGSVVKT